jgi:hypothetical protein
VRDSEEKTTTNHRDNEPTDGAPGPKSLVKAESNRSNLLHREFLTIRIKATESV